MLLVETIRMVAMQGTNVGRSNNVSSISDLVAADPSSANPLIGYHIAKGAFPSSQLTPGAVVNSTATLKQFGVNDQVLTVSIPAQGQVDFLEHHFPVMFLSWSEVPQQVND